MSKRMRELQTEILNKTQAAQGLVEGENKDIVKAKALLDEVDELRKELDTLDRLDKANKSAVPNTPIVKKDKSAVSGFDIISKVLRGKRLTDIEKATLITGTIDTEKAALITGEDAENGENYLIPEDVRLAINELRRSYVSAKDIVTISPTTALTGSENYESGTPSGMIDFEDGDEISEAKAPKFIKKAFKIGWYGSIIPISNVLIGAEKAGLMGYLNRWFVRNAIISENKAIFDMLKSGYDSGTPKALASWKELKSSINTDLDPACLLDGIIVTNQNGFNFLDEAEDSNGRPILQPDPSNATRKLFQGLPIKVFSNAQLPNIDAAHFPIFYGDTKAGGKFIEYKHLQFAFSEHYAFAKNQNVLRVIEGFDIMSADTSAYIYGSLGTKG